MSAKLFDSRWLMAGVAKEMRRRAMSGIAVYGSLNSPYARQYSEQCTGVHQPTGTIIKFTRDQGCHSTGWWKNPDYERCFHLSLSFRDVETGEFAPRNTKLSREWVESFFGDSKTLLVKTVAVLFSLTADWRNHPTFARLLSFVTLTGVCLHWRDSI